MVFLLLGCTLLGTLLLLGSRCKTGATGLTPPDLSATQWWLGIQTACIMRLSGLLVLARKGLFQFDPDEQFRYSVALDFAAHPSLDGGYRGMWMPGNQLYYGLWVKCFPDPFTGFLLGVILSHGINLIAAAWLATTISGRRWAGVLAAMLLAPAYLYQWYGQGPLVEINLSTVMMLMLGCLWRCSRSAPAGPAWRDLFAFGATLAACTFLHLQGWYVACLAGCAWFVIMLARGWLRQRRGWGQLATAALFSAIFPLLWFAHSWWAWGQPTAFLRHIAGIMAEEHAKWNLPFDVQTMLIYPRMLAMQIGWLLPLAIGGAVAARRVGWQGMGPAFFGFCYLGLALGMGLASRFIVPGNIRFMIPAATPIIVGAAMLVGPLENLVRAQRPGGARRLASAGLLLLLLPWYAVNVHRSIHFGEFSHFYNFRADVHPLAEWLRREIARPAQLPDFDPRAKVGIRTGWGPGEVALFVKYYSGSLTQVIPLDEQNGTGAQLADSGCELVISDLDAAPPPGYGAVTQIMQWRVFRRTASAPSLTTAAQAQPPVAPGG